VCLSRLGFLIVRGASQSQPAPRRHLGLCRLVQRVPFFLQVLGGLSDLARGIKRKFRVFVLVELKGELCRNPGGPDQIANIWLKSSKSAD
jgi:hypothetical protein